MKNEEKIKNKIIQILDLVKRCSKRRVPCMKEKLIGVMSIDYGIARRRTLEYLKALTSTGKLIENEDELWDAQTIKEASRKKEES